MVTPRLRDSAEFLLVWGAVLLLAVAVEVAGLYFLQLLR